MWKILSKLKITYLIILFVLALPLFVSGISYAGTATANFTCNKVGPNISSTLVPGMGTISITGITAKISHEGNQIYTETFNDYWDGYYWDCISTGCQCYETFGSTCSYNMDFDGSYSSSLGSVNTTIPGDYTFSIDWTYETGSGTQTAKASAGCNVPVLGCMPAYHSLDDPNTCGASGCTQDKICYSSDPLASTGDCVLGNPGVCQVAGTPCTNNLIYVMNEDRCGDSTDCQPDEVCYASSMALKIGVCTKVPACACAYPGQSCTPGVLNCCSGAADCQTSISGQTKCVGGSTGWCDPTSIATNQCDSTCKDGGTCIEYPPGSNQGVCSCLVPDMNLTYDGPKVNIDEAIPIIYKILFPTSIILGTYFIASGLYMLMTSTGDPRKKQFAVEKLTRAIAGSVVSIGSLVLIRLILTTLLTKTGR